MSLPEFIDGPKLTIAVTWAITGTTSECFLLESVTPEEFSSKFGPLASRADAEELLAERRLLWEREMADAREQLEARIHAS